MVRNNTFTLLFLLFTFFMLYIGLWSELVHRVKFNSWDIIGVRVRVTNSNLFSSLYILGLFILLAFKLVFKLSFEIYNYFKSR